MVRRRSFVLGLVAVFVIAAPASYAANAPRNVIVLIGDGMGFAQTSLARLALGSASSALSMDSMKYAAFVKTQSAGPGEVRGAITDSAAAATALATGFKTKNGMLGVLPDGKEVRSILEAAAAMGKATGLVTNVTVTHATPAGFGAHQASRGDEPEIAPQYLARRVDVVLGGGEAYFIPKSATDSKRKDERDLLGDYRKAGYTVAKTAQELAQARGPRLLGLFGKGYLTTDPPEPSLADMAAKAISVLSANPRGFFVMIEGGQIDGKSHGNDAPGTVKQVYDFDAAIGVALAFARKRGDTLVVVTADHETGGLSIVGPAKDSKSEYAAAWGTKGHSATVVPLLADGPGAELFTGVLDNTDVPKRIAKLWNAKLGVVAGSAK